MEETLQGQQNIKNHILLSWIRILMKRTNLNMITRLICYLIQLAAIESKDTNIVLIGYKVIDHTYSPRATMHKITLGGDVLWQRQYVANNDTLNTNSYGMTIKHCSDKGFVFGGWASAGSLSPSQQMWLVKTDSLGCDGTGDFADDCTGMVIKEFASNPAFYLYPNPTKSTVFVEVESNQYKVESIEVYSLTGKLVKTSPLVLRQAQQPRRLKTTSSIDISGLESGVYLVKVGNRMQKLIVE